MDISFLKFFLAAYFQDMIFQIDKFFLRIDWEIFTAITLMLTMIIIAFQAWYTRRYTRFSVMPNAFCILRSTKTALKRKNEAFPTSTKDKLKTQFIVINKSEFPISFYVKIVCKIDNNIVFPFDSYYKKPLSINTGTTSWPNVIHLEKVIMDGKNKSANEENIKLEIDNIKVKEIIAHIYYRYSPRFATAIKSKIISEDWRFDLKNFVWIGPHGLKDENFYLPGEKKETEPNLHII